MTYTETLKSFCKSKILDRRAKYKIFRPETLEPGRIYPLLILNDGQESGAVQIRSTLETLTSAGLIEPVIVAGIFAGDRMHEYGTSHQQDYAGRGSKSAAYTTFLLEEFIPNLEKLFPVRKQSLQNSIAGYSLGALSAFDIAWNHANYFGAVGCFSGSFWWRTREWKKGRNVDKFRITHNMVRQTATAPAHLRFWFQTGTLDESNDRNRNGIIDSIDDTLDLIEELQQHGIEPGHRLRYIEIEGGKHHPETWALAMKDFLVWGYGRHAQ